MDATRRRWQKDFDAVTAAIPEHWVWFDEDGLGWFRADYGDTDLARLHWTLAKVGFARGWL